MQNGAEHYGFKSSLKIYSCFYLRLSSILNTKSKRKCHNCFERTREFIIMMFKIHEKGRTEVPKEITIEPLITLSILIVNDSQ